MLSLSPYHDTLIFNEYQGMVVESILSPVINKIENLHIFGGCSHSPQPYQALFEVEDGKLYLTEFETSNAMYPRMSKVSDLFPGENRKLVDWYSGELNVNMGEVLLKSLWPNGHIYEQVLMLEIEKGVVLSRQIRDNEPGVILAKRIAAAQERQEEMRRNRPWYKRFFN